MIHFGSASVGGDDISESAARAAREARGTFGESRPALAIAFASSPDEPLDKAFAALRAELGDVPIIGGLANGAVLGPTGVSRRGVSATLLGGDIRVLTRSVALSSESPLEVVAVAKEIAEAADRAAREGFTEFTCLVIASAGKLLGDTDLLLSAVRKGVGQRARLAGAVSGESVALGNANVFAGDRVAGDSLVLCGVFSASPFGIAARHGWRAIGRVRRVTRSDGVWLMSLDGRPAFDVWTADARAAGAEVPDGRTPEAAAYLASFCPLDVRAGEDGEVIVRMPLEARPDGAVRLSGGIGETARTRVVRATRTGLLEAAKHAAAQAVQGVGGKVAGGVVLTCGSRLYALGAEFPREAIIIEQELGAKVGGACVLGEIARGQREVEAFHNATVLVIAVPSDIDTPRSVRVGGVI